MLNAGPALKVTIYLNDDTGSETAFLHQDLLAFLQRRGIEGASVFRLYAGYGGNKRLHITGAGPVQGDHLPIIVTFVDSTQKIETVLPELLAMVSDGLVEAHPTQILKSVMNKATVIT
jgi:PII-like signaling protein